MTPAPARHPSASPRFILHNSDFILPNAPCPINSQSSPNNERHSPRAISTPSPGQLQPRNHHPKSNPHPPKTRTIPLSADTFFVRHSRPILRPISSPLPPDPSANLRPPTRTIPLPADTFFVRPPHLYLPTSCQSPLEGRPRTCPALALESALQLVQQWGDFVFHNIPQDFRIHAVIAMDQSVTESYDTLEIGNDLLQRTVLLCRQIQSFADDLQLSFDRGTHQVRIKESSEWDVLQKGLGANACLTSILKPLGHPWIHRLGSIHS